MATIEIIPVAGRKVLDPQTREVITKRVTVTASPYWTRRINAGDVEIYKPKAAKKEGAQ